MQVLGVNSANGHLLTYDMIFKKLAHMTADKVLKDEQNNSRVHIISIY